MLAVMHDIGLTHVLGLMAALLLVAGGTCIARAIREMRRDDYNAHQTTEGRQPDEWEIAAGYRASHGRQ